MTFSFLRQLSRRVFLCSAVLTLTNLPSAAAENASAQAGPAAGGETLEPVIVSAERLPASAADTAFSVRIIDGETLRRSPALNLDDALRNEAPGFSLFRRSSSRVAHPTTQGVSLRNLGPNGAGRTLVLLDGVPLNDPFAGWVPWQRVPPASLEEVIITRGGGAGLFGNAALAGTIYLKTLANEADFAEVSALGGNHDTWEQSVRGAVQTGDVNLSVFAQHTETGGWPVVRADQRGPVDQDAESEMDLLQGRLTWQAAKDARFEFSAAVFSEERGNGTPLAYNSLDGVDLSAAWIQDFRGLEAQARLQFYFQDRDFSSTFTSVNAARDLETPALDQYSVPSRSAGGSFTWSQRIAESHQLVLGADFRRVEGETNERFRFMQGEFTRGRTAGGAQIFGGVFLEDTWEITPAVKLVTGGRLDYVDQRDGFRREKEAQTGAVLLREEYEDRDSIEPNGRLGLNAKLHETLTARGAVYTGFRQPTLNEFYRPFRVGNEITEANAGLEAERLEGMEAGFDWRPAEEWTFTATGFYNRLHDAVGNVTLGFGPGTFDPGGFVPEGGVLRQRQNIDLVEVSGIETGLHWKPSEHWQFSAEYLYSHAVVKRFPQARELEGNRLEQSPEHIAVFGVDWRPAENWTAALRLRCTGTQYEDDQNTLKLAGFTVLDAGLSWTATTDLTLNLRVENMFDTEYETGKRADGLVSIGTPRLVSLGARYRF